MIKKNTLKTIWGGMLFMGVACSTTLMTVPTDLRETQKSWSTQTLEDIERIQTLLAATHPAFFTEKQKPEAHFLRWYRVGYEEAKRNSNLVLDLPGYYFVLRKYVLGFNDAHLNVGVASFDRFKDQIKFSWPEFAIKRSNTGEYRVSYVSHKSKKLPPLGSKLESCDRRSVTQLLKENVYPYYGNGQLLKTRILFGPRVFVDSKNPFIEIPKRCRFVTGKKKQDFAIKWSPISFDDLWPHIDAGYGGKPNPPGITGFKTEGQWVSLPTFAPDSEAQKTYQEMIKQAEESRNLSALVFDLRGNGGGSSSWGHAFLEAYFGKDALAALEFEDFSKTRITYAYRASSASLDYFKKVLGDV